MQCFDTFRGFLHKIYAATMDGKGQEGTYNFFSRRLGGQPGAGHRAQGAAAPLPPRWRRPWVYLQHGGLYYCTLNDVAITLCIIYYTQGDSAII